MTTVGQTNLLRSVEPVSNAFVWPPPTPEGADDILWLEPEPDRQPAPVNDLPVPEAEVDGGSTGLPISYLLSARVSFEWQDVVALVQELGAQLKDRRPTRTLLALDAITLEPDGRLRARLDTGTIPIVRSLGQVLHQLLTHTPSPANLRLIALQANSETSTFVSIEDLASALEKFERPGRLKTLAALYERARQAAPPVRAAEPVKLEPPAERPLPAIVPKPERQLRKQMEVQWQPQMAALVVATVSLMTIGGFFVFRARPEPVPVINAAAVNPPPALPAAGADVPEPPSNRKVPVRTAKNAPLEHVTNRLNAPAALPQCVRPWAARLPQLAPRELAAESLKSSSVVETQTVVRQLPTLRVPGTPKRSSALRVPYTIEKSMRPRPLDFSGSLLF
jgi:hypothetical protein